MPTWMARWASRADFWRPRTKGLSVVERTREMVSEGVGAM